MVLEIFVIDIGVYSGDAFTTKNPNMIYSYREVVHGNNGQYLNVNLTRLQNIFQLGAYF